MPKLINKMNGFKTCVNACTLVFCMLSWPLSMQAQSSNCDCYERLNNLAIYYYLQGRFSDGLDAMKMAVSYRKDDASPTDLKMLARFYAENDSLEQVYQSILTGIGKGLSMDELRADNFSGTRNKIGEDYWKKIESNYEKYHLQYLSKLNLNYRLQVEWLKGSDQRIRSVLEEIDEKELRHVDSLNFQDLLALFDKYGYPQTSQHGFNWSSIDAFLMHYSIGSIDNFKAVVQILENANKSCSCMKGDIALITDRYMRWANDEPQKYGLWNLWKEKDFFGPIDNIQAIDNRRFEYNLLRLAEQGATEHRMLPAEYQPISYPSNYFCGLKFKH